MQITCEKCNSDICEITATNTCTIHIRCNCGARYRVTCNSVGMSVSIVELNDITEADIPTEIAQKREFIRKVKIAKQRMISFYDKLIAACGVENDDSVIPVIDPALALRKQKQVMIIQFCRIYGIIYDTKYDSHIAPLDWLLAIEDSLSKKIPHYQRQFNRT